MSIYRHRGQPSSILMNWHGEMLGGGMKSITDANPRAANPGEPGCQTRSGEPWEAWEQGRDTLRKPGQEYKR